MVALSEVHVLFGFVGRGQCCALAAVTSSGFGLRLGCRRYGKLRSFFADAIAPNSFLRKVPLTITVSSAARSRIRAELLTVIVSGTLRRNELGAIASAKNDRNFP